MRSPLDEGLVERWLGHRNDVSALAPLWRGGIVVDTAEISGPWSVLPGLFDEVIGALKAIDGTLAASAHQSHAYPDGACLYFTFGGRGPDGDAEWRERYYRQAWDTVTDATLAHGAAISHHHGIGLNRSRFLPRALGSGFDVLGGLKATFDPNGILNPGKFGLGLAVRTGALDMSAGGGSILVVDVGTSGVRAAIVRPDATVEHEHRVPLLPDSPAPGLVEFDAARMADAILEVARAALEAGGSGRGGRDRQPTRASSIVWERATGKPVAPGIGWQDLRTVGTCLVLQAEGIRLAPNASATKVMAILDEVDPERVAGREGRALFRDGRQLGRLDPLRWRGRGERRPPRDRRHQRGRDRPRRCVDRMGRGAAADVADPVGHAADGSSTPPGRPATPPRFPGPHPSAGSPEISKPPSSDRAARFRAWPRPRSAPAACSTSASVPARPPAALGRGDAGTFPIVAFRVDGTADLGHRSGHALGRHLYRMAARRPRDHRDGEGVRRRWQPSARPRAMSGSCRRCSVSARRSGTSAHGARSSA